MRRVRLALLVTVIAGLVGAVAFSVGGWVGFVQGYALASQTGDIVGAGMVLTSFEATAKGDADSARGLLELFIDSALVSEWGRAKLEAQRPYYAPDEYYLDLGPQVERLAQYRKAHPRSLSDEHDKVVAEVIERYTATPATPR
jgi:hypothetical protein